MQQYQKPNALEAGNWSHKLSRGVAPSLPNYRQQLAKDTPSVECRIYATNTVQLGCTEHRIQPNSSNYLEAEYRNTANSQSCTKKRNTIYKQKIKSGKVQAHYTAHRKWCSECRTQHMAMNTHT